jgi:hypothetical protein
MWHNPNRIHNVQGPIVTLTAYADACPDQLTADTRRSTPD